MFARILFNLFIYLFICLFVCLFVYLFIFYLFIFYHSFISHRLANRTRPISVLYDGRRWSNSNLRVPGGTCM